MTEKDFEKDPQYMLGEYIFTEARLFRRHCLEKALAKFSDTLPDSRIFGVKVKITLEYEDAAKINDTSLQDALLPK